MTNDELLLLRSIKRSVKAIAWMLWLMNFILAIHFFWGV